MYYISITGLRLNSVRHAPAFWWFALRSMSQAHAAPGLISADVRRINGVHHTLTAWESDSAMRAFLTTGAHLAAMKAFRLIATGRTIGLHLETIPNWDEAHAIWLAHAVPVRGGAI